MKICVALYVSALAKLFSKYYSFLSGTSKQANSQGVLEGFHLAKHPPLIKEHYPPPTIPPNFIPQHLKTSCVAHQKINISQSRHNLSASDRSLILGEKKFQKVLLNGKYPFFLFFMLI